MICLGVSYLNLAKELKRIRPAFKLGFEQGFEKAEAQFHQNMETAIQCIESGVNETLKEYKSRMTILETKPYGIDVNTGKPLFEADAIAFEPIYLTIKAEPGQLFLYIPRKSTKIKE